MGLESEEKGLGTLTYYKDIERDIRLYYHPSTPFIFDFLEKMREYYTSHPEEIDETDFGQKKGRQ